MTAEKKHNPAFISSVRGLVNLSVHLCVCLNSIFDVEGCGMFSEMEVFHFTAMTDVSAIKFKSLHEMHDI